MPAASAISVSTTQPGCVGQPATLITGSPPRATKPAPSRPPGRSPSYCRPQASVTFGPVAVMPPQAAQEPTATTCVATAASSRTQPIIGTPVPASRWKRPVPFGPRKSAPSTHSTSRRRRPARQSASSVISSRPLSIESEGCHSISMPPASSMAGKSAVSAHSSDMLQPPQPPDCSHKTFMTCLPARSAAAWRAGRRARAPAPAPRASCSSGGAAASRAAPWPRWNRAARRACRWRAGQRGR